MSVRTVILPCTDRGVKVAQAQLDRQGFALPLQSRQEWGELLGNGRQLQAIAAAEYGECAAMVGIGISSTRALPWHWIWRIETLGDEFDSPAGRQLIRAIAAEARRRSSVLKVVVELECRDPLARGALTQVLADEGFRRIQAERVPERTLVIDLAPGVDQILASFSRSTRQNIRAAAKHGLRVAMVEDSRFGDRMNALLADSLARTGAPPQVMDWAAILELSRRIPERSRVVGVFRGATDEPAALVGFAWGLHHGARVEYHTGASDRIPGVRLPILYPALWDLIAWGSRSGGRWFDLGGVTAGSLGSSDALGGISDFKRGFSKDEISLGEEWVYTPNPVRARVADLTSRLARALRSRMRARERARAVVTADRLSSHAAEQVPSTNSTGDG